jgi:hypothetical protein
VAAGVPIEVELEAPDVSAAPEVAALVGVSGTDVVAGEVACAKTEVANRPERRAAISLFIRFLSKFEK